MTANCELTEVSDLSEYGLEEYRQGEESTTEE